MERDLADPGPRFRSKQVENHDVTLTLRAKIVALCRSWPDRDSNPD